MPGLQVDQIVLIRKSLYVAVEKAKKPRDDDIVQTKMIVKDALNVVVEKAKKLKQKRKAAGDASGSTLPPKKLREDYHAATSSTGGKSLAAIRSLLPAGSSVLGAISCYGCPVMTVVTTTVVADVSSVLVPKVRGEPVNPGVFGDSASTDGVHPDFAGTFHPNKSELSDDSFYSSQDLDPQTSHRVYAPKWRVTHDSVLNDPTTDVPLCESEDASRAYTLNRRINLGIAIDAAKSNELRNLEKNLALEEEKSVLSGKS
nr:hypothetical protein [Tanacetum cinerariifolium]